MRLGLLGLPGDVVEDGGLRGSLGAFTVVEPHSPKTLGESDWNSSLLAWPLTFR